MTTGAHVLDADDGAGGRAGTGLWWWPRRRSFALDVSLAAVSALECFAEGVSFAQKTGIATSAGAVFGLIVGGVLLLRRRWPIAVVLLSLAVAPAQLGFLLSVVGLYTLAASEVPRRITVVLAAMTVAGTMIVAFIEMHRNLGRTDGNSVPLTVVVITSVLMAVGVTVPPVLLGLYVGARRRLVESLRERADGLERELTLLAEKASERAERARMDERTRIAREMHDVVAHRVSLMVVHAAALKAVALKDPAKASANAELLGDMGRQALNELRQMLGVLRTGVDGAMVAAGAALPAQAGEGGQRRRSEPVRSQGHPEPEPEPEPDGDRPGLSQLEGLLEESRAAGMCVELTVEGEARPLVAPVEQTVYRVVQEALTNVHKHAAGAKAHVRLAYREAEVAVLIQNGPSDGSPAAALPSGGHGLIGMRERVAALGGGFAAGETGDGGFRVSAMLPTCRRGGVASR